MLLLYARINHYASYYVYCVLSRVVKQPDLNVARNEYSIYLFHVVVCC